MGKASQEAYERGYAAGAKFVIEHERLHRVHQEIEAWRCKCHDVPYKKAPLIAEPSMIQSFGKGCLFEPVAKTNEQSDAELNAELEALRVGEPPEGGKLVTLDQLEEVAAGLLHDGDGDYGWLDSVYDGTSEYARALCELIVQVELDSFGRGEGTGDNARRVAKRLQARLVAEHSTRRAV